MIVKRFRKESIIFQPAKLEESTSELCNPGRGWYQIFTFLLPEIGELQELRWCLKKEESLVLAIINIGKYKNKDLDEDALKIVRDILSFFAQEEKDVILRFVYDNEGKGLEHEPMLFSRIETHIRQVSPIVKEFTGTIFILQGMFIGSWGEMHGSKFLTVSFLTKLRNLLKDAAGESTWLAVRRPVYWRMLHGELNWPENILSTRMGLFDDGIFGSDSHLGTFSTQKKRDAGWEQAWSAEEELEFEELLCQKVPNGGEALYPQDGVLLSGEKMIRRLRRMHITYLNCIHDEKMLEQWRQQKAETAFPWRDSSLYDYIGAHLGYRFCIRRVCVQENSSGLLVELEVENTGFSPCYEQFVTFMEIETADGQFVRQVTDWDMRTLISGKRKVLTWSLPVVKGKLYLAAKRRKDNRILYFAHESANDGRILLGNIR